MGHRTGFTLVELLLALAITAILLTAVALAFNASVINYRENEDIFKAINNARQSLFRITSQLRTATLVDDTAPANECSMRTAATMSHPSGENITYRYDNTARVLYLITNDDLTDDDYVLCSNVNSVTFTKDVFVEDAVTKVKSVQIAISVASDGVEKKLAAAAVVRRNLD
jgi:prepilin-type N-terminal cleavage/methylation domain-containing protein